MSNRSSNEFVKIAASGKMELIAKGMRTPVGGVEDSSDLVLVEKQRRVNASVYGSRGRRRNVYRPVLRMGTGISRSELLGLKWIDFNFTSDSVSIQRAVIITDKGLMLDDTKTTASQRVLALPEITIVQMKQHQARQAAVITASKAGGQEKIALWLNSSFPAAPVNVNLNLGHMLCKNQAT